MIKVRVTRKGLVGLTSASGLLALSSGLTACTAEPASLEDVEVDESAYTVMDPGTGVFELGWAYGAPTGYAFVAKGSVDEYLRARQQMTFAIPAHYLWSRLHPNEALPQDAARLQQLSAKVKVLYVKDGAVFASRAVKTTGWQGTQTWELAATTTSFNVHRRAQGVRFELTITDAGDPAAQVVLGEADFPEVPVVGGKVPNKTVLFDSVGPTMRSRVLEGGLPVRGAELAIAYTDWRAATLVDASRLDRQIGTAQSYGRFGSVEVPIYGELEYEVSYDVAIDGQWQGEKLLTANAASRLVSGWNRTAFETALSLPKKAQKLEVYFHVKTFLKVDYSRYSNIRWSKYQQGERILVAEKWDNENGVVFDNYDFTTEKR